VTLTLLNSAPCGRCARPWTTRWVAHRRLRYSHLKDAGLLALRGRMAPSGGIYKAGAIWERYRHHRWAVIKPIPSSAEISR
jgi:dihydroxyacid dehydratase/phosphogluconate dehydratase